MQQNLCRPKNGRRGHSGGELLRNKKKEGKFSRSQEKGVQFVFFPFALFFLV